MPVWFWLVALVLIAAAVRFVGAWWKFRGARVVRCPENQKPAGVVVDASHAAATALGHVPELRLSSCSRWPEKAGCGQACLAEIHASPEDCLVRNIVSRWLAGKKCVNCGAVFGEISWAGSPPGLLGADKESMEWKQIPAERIQPTLEASQPVCFACHTTISMMRRHPELVVNRHRASN